jgi:hypothetical protein
MIGDPDRHEQKKEKKIKRLLRKSAYAVGIGIGFFLLRFLIAPFIGDNEQANAAITIISLCLVAYGTLMIVTFIFKKDWFVKVDILLNWIIIPIIALKFIVDIS